MKYPLVKFGETARSTMQNVSKEFQTIALCVEVPNFYVFGSGRLAQVRRDGNWMKPCFMQFDSLANDGYPIVLLQHVLGLCGILSEQKAGGLFVIINEDEVRFCQSLNNECTCEKRLVYQIPDDEMVGLASIDGALILNINGEILKVGQKLDAPDVGKYFQEPGRGTKHNSASKYSKATNSVVFVISEDGPISLYYKGDLIGRCFEELFGERVVANIL